MRATFSRLALLALVTFSASPVWACGSVDAADLEPSAPLHLANLEEAQIVYLEDLLEIPRRDLLRYPGKVVLHHIDLNKDGSDEICLSLLTSGTCSNGVSACRMFVLKDWSSEPLLAFFGHLLVAEDIAGQEWSPLVGVSASPSGSIYRKNYTYDGHKYSAGENVQIGSWAGQSCEEGAYSPLCSPKLFERLRR